MEEFIQQLLREQGVPEDLDPEVRTQLVSELSTRATDFINRRLIDAMSDEALEHFNTMLDDESVDAIALQNFVSANVPDKEKVTANTLMEFRTLYLGDKA